MSKVLRECILNVGSKARESAKASSLAFVLQVSEEERSVQLVLKAEE